MDFTQALKPVEENNQPAAAAEQQGQELNDTNTGAQPGGEPQGVVQAADTNTQSQQPNTAAPAASAEPAANQQQQIDYNKIVDEMSGGLFKDVDGFKAALPNIQHFGTLKQENERLTAEMAKAVTFVDDEVRILNELKAGGASREQIDTFHKLNQYGDFNDMPARDALVAKMVLVDGVKPSTAELKVDRDFKLKDDEVSESEREILDDDMRVASINAKKELDKFKVAVSSVDQVPQEELVLQQQAKVDAHQKAVVPYVNTIVQSITNLGSIPLSAKDATEQVAFDIPVDDAAKNTIGQYMQNYFMDGLTPVTPESTEQALEFAVNLWKAENINAIGKAIHDKAVSDTTFKLTGKYENRSGLQQQQDNPIVNGGANPAADMANFASKIANRTT